MKLHPVPPLTTAHLASPRQVLGGQPPGRATLAPRAAFSETARASLLLLLFGLFFYVELVDNRLFL